MVSALNACRINELLKTTKDLPCLSLVLLQRLSPFLPHRKTCDFFTQTDYIQEKVKYSITLANQEKETKTFKKPSNMSSTTLRFFSRTT